MKTMEVATSPQQFLDMGWILMTAVASHASFLVCRCGLTVRFQPDSGAAKGCDKQHCPFVMVATPGPQTFFPWQQRIHTVMSNSTPEVLGKA